MIGWELGIPSSDMSLTNQATLAVACDIALYLASAELLETVGCFLDFQLMGELPKSIMWLVTDLLEKGYESQSLSENTLWIKGPSSLRRIACPEVPFKYQSV